MKAIRRWLLRIVLGLVLVFALLFLLRGPIACRVLAHKIRKETGLPVKVQTVSFGGRSGMVSIRGLTINNLPEFGSGPFVELPEIYLEYDRARLKEGDLLLRKGRLHLASLTIVRTTNGVTNLERLKGRTASKASTQKSSASERFRFKGIESLELTLGKVRLITLGTTNSITETDLQVRNAVLRNIKTQEELYSGLIEILLLRGGDYSEGPMNELLKQGGSIHPSATNASENLPPPNDVRP